MRVLILSWEYPPVVEGGLARHVRKLAENLVADGIEVHVLTRGSARRGGWDSPQDRRGVMVHRVKEKPYPKDLEQFIAWVRRMNEDMLAAGRVLADELDIDLVHGHDWLVAVAGKRLADQARVPFVTTIHATEYGRHQGWVHQPPMSDIHRTERWMAHCADQVIVCSHYMRGHVADIYDLEEDRVAVIPNGIDPDDLVAVDDLDALRARFAAPDEQLVLLIGRLVYEKGFQLALDALPGLIEEVVGLRFNGGDAEHLAFMVERMLTDHELRDRLVTQAGEHVLRFDWSDIARQTGAVYAEVAYHRGRCQIPLRPPAA